MIIVSMLNENDRRISYRVIDQLPIEFEIYNNDDDFCEGYDKSCTFYFYEVFDCSSIDEMLNDMKLNNEHAGFHDFEYVNDETLYR